MEARLAMNRLCTIAFGVLSFTLAGVVTFCAFHPKRKPRAGWDRAFREMHERGDDKLIELPESSWDKDQWEW
jgi:hypothetical protein